MRQSIDAGNGDACPLTPEHGRMFTVKGSEPARQWCPHQEHDPSSKRPGTPAFWPLHGLELAVAVYLKAN